MKWEYLVMDWELPGGFSATEDKQRCFCRAGVAMEILDGLTRMELEEAFRRLGADRWELVQVYEHRKFYFKRPSAT
jgi:hypothetical protein